MARPRTQTNCNAVYSPFEVSSVAICYNRGKGARNALRRYKACCIKTTSGAGVAAMEAAESPARRGYAFSVAGQ